ncbi:hypothetical protein HFO95_28885 [Rhizobium leguminosarum]|nr:hypothetical protein [Rhizobium leguminosarum]
MKIVRLACYDAIFKKTVDAQPEAAPSKWTVETQKSKMDDSETVYMALTSEQFGSVINIRCEEKVTSVILPWVVTSWPIYKAMMLFDTGWMRRSSRRGPSPSRPTIKPWARGRVAARCRFLSNYLGVRS